MNIEVETHNGEPCLLELQCGPSHPYMPMTAFCFAQTLEADQVAEFTKKLDALSTLFGEAVDVPDELRDVLTAAADGDGQVAIPATEPFSICWN